MRNTNIHIIWDLDGTLVNSSPEIVKHLERAVEKANISPSLKEKEFRVGPPLDQMILEAYPKISPEKIEEITIYYRTSYDHSDFAKTLPFEGIEGVLKSIAQTAIVNHIVTNKPNFPTQRILEKLGWISHFKTVKTPYVKGETLIKKKDLMKEILDEFSLNPQNVISIGDTATDAVAAKANTIRTVGVLWGTGTTEELCPVCDELVNQPNQIISLL